MHITGVVLAGGLSQRMKQDKATLQRNGQSMLAFACDRLASLPIQNIVINANVPHDAPYPVIPDYYPHCGPLSGLHAVAKALLHRTDALMCMPIDQPHMSIDTLLELLQKGVTSHHAVHFDSQPLPLWLPLQADTLNELESRLALPMHTKAQFRLGNFCQCIGAEVLPTSVSDVWINTNTPEQWREAHKKAVT